MWAQNVSRAHGPGRRPWVWSIAQGARLYCVLRFVRPISFQDEVCSTSVSAVTRLRNPASGSRTQWQHKYAYPSYFLGVTLGRVGRFTDDLWFNIFV